MDFSQVNIFAVIIAAISSFAVGGLWYSRLLFGNAWMKASGITEEASKNANMGKIFGFAFIFSLVMSLNLALFLTGPQTDAIGGLTAGFLAGFGWVAMGIGIISMFEQRSWTYILIHAGYMVAAMVVMGLILGVWR